MVQIPSPHYQITKKNLKKKKKFLAFTFMVLMDLAKV